MEGRGGSGGGETEGIRNRKAGSSHVPWKPGGEPITYGVGIG
jgi:hypothetical protein